MPPDETDCAIPASLNMIVSDVLVICVILALVAAAWGEKGRIALFKHDGDPRGKWSMQMLKENWPLANQVILADLNGDGRLDIIACAERGSNELRWWRNEGTIR